MGQARAQQLHHWKGNGLHLLRRASFGRSKTRNPLGETANSPREPELKHPEHMLCHFEFAQWLKAGWRFTNPMVWYGMFNMRNRHPERSLICQEKTRNLPRTRARQSAPEAAPRRDQGADMPLPLGKKHKGFCAKQRCACAPAPKTQLAHYFMIGHVLKPVRKTQRNAPNNENSRMICFNAKLQISRFE